MNSKSTFKTKEDDSVTVNISLDEVEEIVPDADMRFSLVILKNGEKHFLCGSATEIMAELESA